MPRDDEDKFAKRPRLIRRSEVRERIGLSTSTLYEMIAAGDFPSPIPIGRQAVAWIESEVDAWIEQKIKQRDNRTHKHNAP